MFNESINYEALCHFSNTTVFFFVHFSSLPRVLRARGYAWPIPLIWSLWWCFTVSINFEPRNYVTVPSC